MGHSDDEVLNAAEVAVMDEMEDIDLAAEHVRLKVQISRLQERLDKVNETLAARLEHPADGSKTHKVENMKIKVTGRINRRLDRDVWLSIRDNFNVALRPVKDSLDESAWKKLQKENPDVAARIAPAIVESAGKTGIEISF